MEDDAYDSFKFRNQLKKVGVKNCINPRKNLKIPFDKKQYKENENKKIENAKKFSVNRTFRENGRSKFKTAKTPRR